MRKIFTLICALFASIALFATEMTLWEATYTDGVELNNETVASFKVGDTLRIYLTVPEGGANFKICYKGAPAWTETTIPSLESQWPWVNGGEDRFELPLTQADITAFEGMNIYIYQGENSLIHKVTLVAEDEEPGPTTIILVEGDTTTLWEDATGVEMTWNEICEQDSSLGAQLAENDKIIITISAKNPATEWPKVILRDATSAEVTNELLNDISTFPHDVAFTLTTEQAAAVQAGFRISGDGVTITKVAAYKYKAGDEPQPSDTIDYTGLVETVVYAPESPIAISWDESAYAGTKIDTHTINETMFAGLQANHIIRVTVVDAAEDAQYSMQYKAGDEWTWTDLSINTATAGYIAYIVASDDMAMLIADRGLVIQGIRYKINGISVFSEDPLQQGIENTNANANAKAVKLLRDGLLIIIRDGKIYNAMGVEVR